MAAEAGPHSRARRIATALMQLLLAVAAGLGSAWAVLKSSAAFGESAGPWRVSTLAGSADADLYTRARVALGGLLALNRQETMYYVADTDNFHVLNDRQAGDAPVHLVLRSAAPAGTAASPGEASVTSPSRRGLLLLRLLVGDPTRDLAAAEAARRTLRCDPA